MSLVTREKGPNKIEWGKASMIRTFLTGKKKPLERGGLVP